MINTALIAKIFTSLGETTTLRLLRPLIAQENHDVSQGFFNSINIFSYTSFFNRFGAV